MHAVAHLFCLQREAASRCRQKRWATVEKQYLMEGGRPRGDRAKARYNSHNTEDCFVSRTPWRWTERSLATRWDLSVALKNGGPLMAEAYVEMMWAQTSASKFDSLPGIVGGTSFSRYPPDQIWAAPLTCSKKDLSISLQKSISTAARIAVGDFHDNMIVSAPSRFRRLPCFHQISKYI